jgi:hypothetical protein
MAHTACLVCLVSAVNGCSKKSLGRAGASSVHITNLKQSIFSFDIYGTNLLMEPSQLHSLLNIQVRLKKHNKVWKKS